MGSDMRLQVWLLLALGACACPDKNKDGCKYDNITKTDDCRYLNSCDSQGCCIHKDLMPLKPPEAGGTILVFVISGMANAGGIGGGPIMTALEILLFYFNPKQSIPLSQVVIVAGGVVSLAIRAFLRHPTKNRPLLEYHVSMIIIPPILLGSTFGVMVNKVLPNVAILVMLTIVLIFITWLTTKNGIKMFRAETKQRKDAAEKAAKKENGTPAHNGPENGVEPAKELELVEGEILEREEDPLKEPAIIFKPLEEGANTDRAQAPVESEGVSSEKPMTPPKEETSPELANIYKRESRQFPLIPCAWIVFIVAYVALGLSIRGGSGTSFAGIEFCGKAFKIFYAIWSFFLLVFTFLPFWYLLRLKRMYDRIGYAYDEFDIKWNMKSCMQVYLAGFFGGFGGSLLGFGASLLVAPILVQWKMRSPVIGPTAALMTVVGSAISVMQFAQQGLLDGPYAGWLAMVAFLGSLVGVLSITKLMRKLGRNSLLVLILACVLAIAMFLVPIYTLVDIIKKEKDGKGDYKLKPYCG